MSADHSKRTLGKDLLLASAMVMVGLTVSGLALTQLRATHDPQVAQATPPLQSSPPSDQDKSDQDKPAESKPGGTRPTTPAPEPARPDSQAQQQGAKAALPPAPAEKVAPPIKDR
jgi:cytoskeletal protein RodZ